MTKNNIIFDLDGTLIDSAPSILACFSRVLEVNGIASLIPLTDSVVGPPLVSTLKILSGVEDEKKLKNMVHQFIDYYDFEACLIAKPYNEVAEGLANFLSVGCSLHIATNKRYIPTQKIIKHLGWETFFSSILSIDQFSEPFVSKSKMLGYQLNAHNLHPSKTIYVGDRMEDLQAAFENHLEFVGVSWGYGEFTSSTIVVQSFSKLKDLIN